MSSVTFTRQQIDVHVGNHIAENNFSSRRANISAARQLLLVTISAVKKITSDNFKMCYDNLLYRCDSVVKQLFTARFGNGEKRILVR